MMKIPQTKSKTRVFHVEDSFAHLLKEKPLGNDLLSQEVALQVPSALTSLTSGFGMGPGVPSPLKSPRDVFTTLLLNSN